MKDNMLETNLIRGTTGDIQILGLDGEPIVNFLLDNREDMPVTFSKEPVPAFVCGDSQIPVNYDILSFAKARQETVVLNGTPVSIKVGYFGDQLFILAHVQDQSPIAA